MKRFLCGLMALCLLVGITGQAMAQPSYVYTTPLDFSGWTDTGATEINDSGQIVGFYDDGFDGAGFLLDNGNFTLLYLPPGTVPMPMG
jgi:hypothetical protein